MECKSRSRTIWRHSPAKEQDSVYGLVNAVTLAAQSLPPDDRYSLEALAATLLERE